MFSAVDSYMRSLHIQISKGYKCKDCLVEIIIRKIMVISFAFQPNSCQTIVEPQVNIIAPNCSTSSSSIAFQLPSSTSFQHFSYFYFSSSSSSSFFILITPFTLSFFLPFLLLFHVYYGRHDQLWWIIHLERLKYYARIFLRMN